MLDRAEAFEKAYASYSPAPYDPPANIPFYRAFDGLRAAWGVELYEIYRNVVRETAYTIASLNPPADERYAVALAVLRVRVEEATLPPEPQPVFNSPYGNRIRRQRWLDQIHSIAIFEAHVRKVTE